MKSELNHILVNVKHTNFSTSFPSIRRQTSTSATTNEHEHILQQQRAVRPLSPHLQIYQPQLTWMLSIAHRFSGAGVATGKSSNCIYCME